MGAKEVEWEKVSSEIFEETAAGIRSTEPSIIIPNPFLQDEKKERSLLHFVCKEGCADEVIAYLINVGVPIDSRDFKKQTPLHHAAKKGKTSAYKLLVASGADEFAKNERAHTPLCAAAECGNTEMVVWIMKQHMNDETKRLQWDDDVFACLMEFQPDLATMYLDMFAVDLGFTCGNKTKIKYFDLRLIYGEPKHPRKTKTKDANQKMDTNNSALETAVKHAERKNVLNHRAIRHVMSVKWKLLRYIFSRELYAYTGLLISYYSTIIFGDPNWIGLKNGTDYGVMIMRAISWACCIFLIAEVEYSEFKGGQYFGSYWNWLNMTTYGGIIASIPLELLGGNTNKARDGLLSVINVLLWINLLQYMIMHKKIGLLITTMGRMLHDVRQFLMLYLVFLLGFSSAIHLVLHGATGYENYLQTFLTVLLMLFGNITYDPPYNKAKGWEWAFANLLLFAYLICVVVMLLNVLIAMLSTSHNYISESAEEQYYLHKAETILRIESTVTYNKQIELYKWLVPPGTKSQESTHNATENCDVDQLESNVVTEQTPPYMGDIPLQDYDRSKEAVKQRQKDKRLLCLEDGIRSVKAGSKQRTISLDMEARFDSLQVSVTEITNRLDSLQKFVTEMVMQHCVLTAAATNGQTDIKRDTDIPQEIPEDGNNQEFQELAEAIIKTDDVRDVSLMF